MPKKVKQQPLGGTIGLCSCVPDSNKTIQKTSLNLSQTISENLSHEDDGQQEGLQEKTEAGVR